MQPCLRPPSCPTKPPTTNLPCDPRGDALHTTRPRARCPAAQTHTGSGSTAVAVPTQCLPGATAPACGPRTRGQARRTRDEQQEAGDEGAQAAPRGVRLRRGCQRGRIRFPERLAEYLGMLLCRFSVLGNGSVC